MKHRYRYISLIVFVIFSCTGYSQINCTVPLPPVLTNVSVQHETGNTELSWIPSPSTDIAAYIVYSYEDGDGMPIDTLWNPLATNYLVTNTATKYSSVAYVVAAYRLPGIPGMEGCPSPLSNILSTIFCSSEIDTCKKEIIVSWNNYADFPKHVIEYKIFISVNESPLSELYSVNNITNTFTTTDFETDSEYCFVIKAILDDGSLSGSNKSCLTTSMQRPPQWINADQATIDDENRISLSFSFDPLSEITRFRLERRTGSDSPFQEIAQPVSVDGKVLYTDNMADVNMVNYYRLSAINNCNIPVKVSNLSSNIVLSLERTGDDFKLSWNPYKEWMGIVWSYRLYINTGSGFEEREVLQPDDTLYAIEYQELMYEVSGSELCFYVVALETSNPYNINGESLSSRICTAPTELVTVPNVFTPNNDLVNDLFKPVLSFTPLEYHLIITNRRGNSLYETRDHRSEWDGSQNGNPQPEGVYLWFLRVSTPSGKNISRTGTITIITER